MSETLVKKLQKLRQFNVIESKFVRAAIEEKLEKELPQIKIKEPKSDCPF